MTSINQFWRRAKLPLAVSLASTLAGPAFGVSFNVGEIEGQFDSSLSVGASWSTQNADKHLIGSNNGGTGLSQTSDDGHLNFKAGDTFSKIFKGIHDLELKYGDTGVFVRGKYWYDFKLQDDDLHFKNIDNDHRYEAAKSSGSELLDAFVYHNYSIGNEPGSVRLGKQVVSWGESTFIGGGINSINPIDVSAFRRPGAEIKEGLIPVNMFYLSQSITENLSAEGFYQIGWDKTVVDNCGTFFSQPDVIAKGCDNNLAVLKSSSAISAALPAALRTPVANSLAQQGVRFGNPDEGAIVARGPDRTPKDSGQFGLATHYNFEPLDTEFGAYFMNYHSRLPIFSGKGGPASVYNPANLVGSLVRNGVPLQVAAGLAPTLLPVVVAANSSYYVEYPEDIRLYGLSFSTTLPTGTAWAGEISYRPNAPVQVNTTDILYSGLSPLNPNVSPLKGTPGADQPGYRRKEITQLQTTFTQFFDQVMGAERLTVVGEVGWTHMGGLDNPSEVRYGRDPSYGPGPLPNGQCVALNTSTLAGAPQNNVSKYCENDGFTTSDSWGYRARAIWDYNSVFAGINLKPSVAWSHDVKGYSPGPGGNFEEGRKAVSLALDAEYQNTYTANLSYTNFFGGDYSTVDDRDFVALSFGVNF
ncbi:MAG: type secretory pathway, adhesin AidA [Pseudomonas sp.]|nr:type secretory pathway, adhesin AidA [Pseudomonas sp.]